MEQGSQDIYVRCRGMLGMWTWQVTSLYLQIRPADNCLLLRLPRSQKFVFVYWRNVCGDIKDSLCLKILKNDFSGNTHTHKKSCSSNFPRCVRECVCVYVCKRRVGNTSYAPVLSLRICDFPQVMMHVVLMPQQTSSDNF